MIAIENGSSLSEAIEDARRLQHLPTPDMTAALNTVLHAAFLDTQDRAHVLTGRLKASGRMSSEASEDEWRGQIVYGGPALEYVIYEMSREGHDWFAGLPLFDEAFEDAIDRGIRRAAG